MSDSVGLVLERRPGDSILIGDDIVVTVTRIKGQYVKLGIKAPKDVEIDRPELRAKKLAERERQT